MKMRIIIMIFHLLLGQLGVSHLCYFSLFVCNERYSVKIPEKMNPKQAFEQIKKYMELFIQEYEEEEEDTTAQSRNLETNLNNETEMS
jgi:hypothetical protein